MDIQDRISQQSNNETPSEARYKIRIQTQGIMAETKTGI